MEEINYAYSEVLEVLENMEEKYVKRIPVKLVKFFKENSTSKYKKHLNTNLPLEEQNLMKETKSILALINIKYWVKEEKHREELLKNYKKNNK